MLALYLLLTVAGIVVTVMLTRRRSWHVVTGMIGTLLAILSVVAGFTAGPYIAPIALIVLLLACLGLRHHPNDPAAGPTSGNR
jgi:hypothetical protein